MNRVCFILDENGELSGVASDAEIEVLIVQPSCARDKVYKYGSAQFGPQYVQIAIGGEMIGHAGDDMLAGGTQYGRLPPSKASLELVKMEANEP